VVVATSESLLLVKWQVDVSAGCITSFLVEILEIFNLLAFVDQKSANHDGASIHHRVVRSPYFIEYRCVENLTTGFLTNILVYILTTAFFYVEIVNISVGNNLAYRLH